MSDKLEAGSIVEGKIIRVKPFGAIVAIDGAGHGLVHISQISAGFVKDINEHAKVGDIVKVKVLSVDEETGKISLSMKDALPKENSKPRLNKNNYRKDFQPESTIKPDTPSNSFEDKMKEFLKSSSEKQAVLNKRISKR